MILQELIDWAKTFAAVIFLEVRVSNLVAINLYNSLGFFEVGCRPNYYPATNGREDALVFSLPLETNRQLIAWVD